MNKIKKKFSLNPFVLGINFRRKNRQFHNDPIPLNLESYEKKRKQNEEIARFRDKMNRLIIQFDDWLTNFIKENTSF